MLSLANPKRSDISPVEANAKVDLESAYLVMPERVRAELQLELNGNKQVETADGSHRLFPYVGPIEARFGNRVAYLGAIVVGDEVLLGTMPMEDMDLVLMPKRRLAVNPESPDVASGKAK